MKFKFKCRGCKKELSCDSASSGDQSICPTCGTEIKIPYPGIGIGKFWGYWVLLLILSVFFGQMGGFGMIILIGLFGFNLYIKYLRVINIGMNPHWAWLGVSSLGSMICIIAGGGIYAGWHIVLPCLIAGLFTLWIGVASTGSAKKKSRHKIESTLPTHIPVPPPLPAPEMLPEIVLPPSPDRPLPPLYQPTSIDFRNDHS